MSPAYLKVKNEWSYIFIPSASMLWEEVKGREYTDRQDLGGTEVSEFLLTNNICGNKIQQQENKSLEQAYCNPVTRLDENCLAFRTSSILLRLTMRFKQLHHPM